MGWDNACIGVYDGYEYVPVLRVLLCVEYIHRMDIKFISWTPLLPVQSLIIYFSYVHVYSVIKNETIDATLLDSTPL